jgi:hypothetical protein
MNTEIIALPQMAPLNTRMVLYLLGMDRAEIIKQVRTSANALLERLVGLETHIHALRDELFTAMHQQKPITVEWLRSAVFPSKKSHPREPQNKGVTRDTFARWYKEGKLRKVAHGKPDLDNIAAIIISSRIIKSMPASEARRFASPIPPDIRADDELLWCFRQAPPRDGQPSPILPCPWPTLPAKLAPGTLLISGWPMFDPMWTQYPGSGAVCFSSLDEESLEAWDPTIKASDIRRLLENARRHISASEFETMREQILRSYGQSILNRLALSRLFALPSVRYYPILWESEVIWPEEVSLAPES